MHKQLLLASVMFALACSAATDTPTGDFDVQIAQTDASPVGKRGETLARMELAITVTNRTEYPWRVESVGVQSVTATHFSIPPTPQPWGQMIAPGRSNELAFWTVVQATINFSKLTVPMRVKLVLVGPNGERRSETFTRNMEASLEPAT